MKIQGFVAEGYDEVKQQFVLNFEEGRENDAQLCVYVDGKVLIYVF